MKQRLNRHEAEVRIKGIENNAIEQLATQGFAEFESSLEDTKIMIQKVAELLFEEQIEHSSVLSNAKFSASLPEIAFRDNKLFVRCVVTMSNPANITFEFSYQLKNGNSDGKLELINKVRTKITPKNGMFKNIMTNALLKQFHVEQKAQDTIANINEVLLHILAKKHGYPSCLKKVQLKINHSSLTIRLES